MDERSFVRLEIERPVLNVPLSKGDHVLIYTKTDGVINMKVTDLGYTIIYGWRVPEGYSPWMVANADRVRVMVEFSDIERIEISRVDYSKVRGKVYKEVAVTFIVLLIIFAPLL